MSLREEITAKRQEIVVDSYPMSIGEMVNLYKDGELDIHPEFQRFYRWDKDQKVNLIESILLGIPIPPIFVFQKSDGKWEVIDGQQRISTILQFLQVLKKDDGELYEPLVLGATHFLPSLEGVRWDNDELFTSEQRIIFKREKLNFTIIKENGENDTSKYEMFQRLNTGGTHLSAQEIRNCLLLMINKQLYDIMYLLCEDSNFKECSPLTDSQIDECYNVELIVRYLLYISFSNDFLSNLDKSKNMDIFLTEEFQNYSRQNNTLLQEEQDKFHRIFLLLNESYGENAFKKYQGDKFKGPLLISAFEAIIPGLYQNIEYWELHKEELRSRIKDIYSQSSFSNAVRRGVRPLDRMSQLIKFSRDWFAHEN